MVSRSPPETLSPTGVRSPVLSMSIRPLMGIVQALTRPGRLRAWFIWLMRSSWEMWSGVICLKMERAQPGAQPEYQVSAFRHSDFGLRMMTVSSMDRGAGSVDVSARPALPRTLWTSGNCRMMRSVTWRTFWASVIDRPGMVVGMYSSDPSSRGGMNSEPSLRNTGTVRRTMSTANPITSQGRRRDQRATGS